MRHQLASSRHLAIPARRLGLTALLCSVLMAGCSTAGSDGSPSATPSPAPVVRPDLPNVEEQATGPQSPIAYGFEVPKGATQLGPLVRYRSPALIAEYQPELEAVREQERAEAEQEAREKAEEAAESGETYSPTPSPLPTATPTMLTRPERDTFADLPTAPRPDVTVSTMRVDGSPTKVLQRLMAQVNAVIPQADLDPQDLSTVCSSRDRRITGCRISVEGRTPEGRLIGVDASMDPGNTQTRVARPMSGTSPVLIMKVAYLGDQRAGQATKPETVDVPSDVDADDRSDLIWPRMDFDAPVNEASVAGWDVLDAGQLLLNGAQPPFAVMAASTVVAADSIARDFARDFGRPDVDVVEDLNEISTTYTSTTEKGTAVGSFVLTARGAYAMVFFWPTPTR